MSDRMTIEDATDRATRYLATLPMELDPRQYERALLTLTDMIIDAAICERRAISTAAARKRHRA